MNNMLIMKQTEENRSNKAFQFTPCKKVDILIPKGSTNLRNDCIKFSPFDSLYAIPLLSLNTTEKI